METQSKPAAINNRQLALEWLGLIVRAFAGGMAVSIAAALLIVSFITFVS